MTPKQSRFCEEYLTDLNASERRGFRLHRHRAEVIGREEANRHQDFSAARRATIERVKDEYGSIIGTILLALLIKVAVEAIWAYLKHKWPDVFFGEMPSDEGMIS